MEAPAPDAGQDLLSWLAGFHGHVHGTADEVFHGIAWLAEDAPLCAEVTPAAVNTVRSSELTQFCQVDRCHLGLWQSLACQRVWISSLIHVCRS